VFELVATTELNVHERLKWSVCCSKFT